MDKALIGVSDEVEGAMLEQVMLGLCDLVESEERAAARGGEQADPAQAGEATLAMSPISIFGRDLDCTAGKRVRSSLRLA